MAEKKRSGRKPKDDEFKVEGQPVAKRDVYNKVPINTDRDRCRQIILANMGNIYEWVKEENVSLSEICRRLGIYRQAFYYARQQFPEIDLMMQEAKEAQVDNVEEALYAGCRDRIVEAEKVLHNGKKVKYKKVIPASDNLIKYVLNNRRPDEWSDKKEIEVTKKEIIVDIIETDNYKVIEDIEPVEED